MQASLGMHRIPGDAELVLQAFPHLIGGCFGEGEDEEAAGLAALQRSRNIRDHMPA